MSSLARTLAHVFLLGATLALAACGDDVTGQCATNADCPAGRYCGPQGQCTFDCITNEDCPSGTCSSLGQCVSKSDAGPGDGPAADKAQAFEGGNPDKAMSPDKAVSPDKAASPDTAMSPDKAVSPDKAASPDTAVSPDKAVLPDKAASPDKAIAVDQSPTVDKPLLVDVPVSPDKAVAPDQAAPDSKSDMTLSPDGPVTCGSYIGKPCTPSGGECGTLATCLLFSSNSGICACPCTPDNKATPAVNEDTCPDPTKNLCADVELTSGTSNYCFQTCNPKLGSNDCRTGLTCAPEAGRYVGLMDKTVCLFPGCTADADCPVYTSTVCTVGSNTCPSGQSCLRFSGSEGRCVKSGKCDVASGLCAPHTAGKSTALIGDPCQDDTECAGNMFCLMPFNKASYQKKTGSCTDDSECCSGSCNTMTGQCVTGLCPVLYRNGYCAIYGCIFGSTLTQSACPSGSACNRLFQGGLCQKSCRLDVATDCRNNPNDVLGDYECRAWSNVTLSSIPVTTGPVCDFGTDVRCDTFWGTSLDCTVLGAGGTSSDNPTNMRCRTLDNATASDQYSSNGYCLDDTAASANKRANPYP